MKYRDETIEEIVRDEITKFGWDTHLNHIDVSGMSNYLMCDSMDFRWIYLENKIIYGRKLTKILGRSYNRKWNGELLIIDNNI